MWKVLVDVIGPLIERLLAIAAGVLPRRVWPRFEPPLPIARNAVFSGLVTFAIGFAVGFDGFMDYAGRTADETNSWMLRNMSAPCAVADCASQPYRLALTPYGVSAVTLFAYLFFTPTGLLSMYATVSGFVRFVAAYFGDPHGDFVLAGVHAAWTSLLTSRRARRNRRVREAEEGPDVADVLGTGDWAGLPVDYVVIASRRKPAWDAGAIILSSADWYRLGAPLETRIDGRLRMLYPLTRLDAAEVVRRGIEYELPRLSPRYARRRTSR
jgi:hypothetical protein